VAGSRSSWSPRFYLYSRLGFFFLRLLLLPPPLHFAGGGRERALDSLRARWILAGFALSGQLPRFLLFPSPSLFCGIVRTKSSASLEGSSGLFPEPDVGLRLGERFHSL